MKILSRLIVLIALQLAVLGDSIGSDELSINSVKWLESKVAKITWSRPGAIDVISYNVFVSDGTLTEFPHDIAETQVDKDATAWESTPRKTLSPLSHIGVDIRHPGQWGNRAILTPGYTYTIGIEMDYLDKETRAKKKQRVSTVLQPLGIFESASSGHFRSFAEHDINQFNKPYVINENGKSVFLLNGTRHLIDGIKQLQDRDVFKLNNNEEIHVFYKPKRPELFGNFDSAKMTLFFTGFLSLTIFGLVACIIIFHIIDIWNVSTSEPGQLEEIIEVKIRHGIIGAISLYFYTRLVKVLHNNENLKYFGLELPEEQIGFLNDVGDAIHRYCINQRQKMHCEIQDLINKRRAA